MHVNWWADTWHENQCTLVIAACRSREIGQLVAANVSTHLGGVCLQRLYGGIYAYGLGDAANCQYWINASISPLSHCHVVGD
jgi:hypothetical protein